MESHFSALVELLADVVVYALQLGRQAGMCEYTVTHSCSVDPVHVEERRRTAYVEKVEKKVFCTPGTVTAESL